MGNSKGLRYGIIIDSHSISKWQLSCINKLSEKQDNLSLVLIEKNNKPERSGKNLLFNVSEQLLENALTRKKSFSHLKNIYPDISVRCVDSKGVGGLVKYSSEDLKVIHDHNLDFIIRFTRSQLAADILTAPRYGVWAFQFCDITKYGGEVQGFWEVYNEEVVTKGYLVRLGHSKQRVEILKMGTFSTISSSYYKNRKHLQTVIADWAALVSLTIKANTFSPMLVEINERMIHHQTPTNQDYLIYIGKVIKYRTKKLFDLFFRYEYWNVGISNKPIESFINHSKAEVTWLLKEDNLYYADPFAYQEGDEYYLMVEELNEKVVSGYLTRFTLKHGELSSIEKSVLKLPSHMSYPFILEDKGETYCIPETSEEREVAIYKLDKETGDWRKVKVLIRDFPAVDSTIIKHDGKWWLFCTNADHGALRDLYIFHSEDLFGPWKPHLLNPVKQDVRSSRPAGTIFLKDRTLYRPAQDCSLTYGGRITINRIHVLTTNAYHEEVYTYINPESDSLYSDGTHTISSVGDLTLFDGKRVDYSISNVIKKLFMLKHKFKRRAHHLISKVFSLHQVNGHKNVSKTGS